MASSSWPAAMAAAPTVAHAAKPLTAVWSTKGGVGVSSAVAMLAMSQVERAHDVVVVDLCGDMAAVFGIDDPTGPGLVDWCALADPHVEALARIETVVRPGLSLLHTGPGELTKGSAALIDALRVSQRVVIVDCGLVGPSGFARQVAAAAERRLLVVRPCFLTLRSVRNAAVDPTGVIMMRPPDRSLGLGDVESVVAAPVLADIAVAPALARTIDAGLGEARLPRRLIRQLARVLPDAT